MRSRISHPQRKGGLGDRPIIREMVRDEVDLVWTIDRSEVIDGIYRLAAGRLVLEPERFVMTGWPEGEPERYGPMLLECFDRGGLFLGAFDGPNLMGVAVLESRFIGRQRDTLQLKFLHVSKEARGSGLGRRLFELAAGRAARAGAGRLYISSIPARNTVHFYQHLGCRLADEIDTDLFELEPEDIHLEFDLRPDAAAGSKEA